MIRGQKRCHRVAIEVVEGILASRLHLGYASASAAMEADSFARVAQSATVDAGSSLARAGRDSVEEPASEAGHAAVKAERRAVASKLLGSVARLAGCNL